MSAPVFSDHTNKQDAGTDLTSTTVTLPTYAAGDVVCLQVYTFVSAGFGSGNIDTPAGWSRLYDPLAHVWADPIHGDLLHNLGGLYYKSMDGSEGVSVVVSETGFNTGNNIYWNVSAATVQGASATPIDGFAVAKHDAFDQNSLSLADLTPTQDNCLVVHLGFIDISGVSFTAPGGDTQRYSDSDPTIGEQQGWFDVAQTTATPVTGETLSWSAGNVASLGITLALAPGGAPPPSQPTVLLPVSVSAALRV